MAKNINQIYAINPLTQLPSGGLLYLGDSGVDAAIQIVNIFNSTNLQLTAGQLNTIQDIDTSANVIFSSLEVDSILSKTAATSLTITPTAGHNLNVILSAGGFLTAGSASQFTVSDLGAITGLSLNLSSLTASYAVVTDGSKNLASLLYGTASSASSLVQRDASQNAFANSFTNKATNVVSAAGTTTLTAASARWQNLTGSTTQTFQLPDATTLSIGARFDFNNNSSGLLTVTDGSGSTIFTVAAGAQGFALLLVNVTVAGAWDYHFTLPANAVYGTAGLTVTGKVTCTTFQMTTGAALNRVLTSDGSGNASWTALSSIGVTTAAGTSNQVLVNGGTAAVSGAITLSLPQSIATTSTVQFGKLGIGSSPGSARCVSITAAITASANLAIGVTTIANTYTCAANNDDIVNVRFNPDTIVTGSFTGLDFFNLYLLNSGATKSGAGTIDNYYGIYGDASTIAATNSWGLYILRPASGATNRYTAYLDNIIGIGTTPNAAYAINIGGILTAQDAAPGSMIGLFVGHTLAPAAACSNAIASYIFPTITPSSGTTARGIGLLIDPGATGGGSITDGFSLYTRRAAYGTNKYTAFFENFVGIGLSSTTRNFCIRASDSAIYNNVYIDGTLTATSGNQQLGVLLSQDFNPTSGASTGCYGLYSQMLFRAPNGQTIAQAANTVIYNYYTSNAGTITTGFGLLIESGGSTIGTITNNYALYVNRPAAGTNRYTAYLDAVVSIGQTPYTTVSFNNGGTITGTAGDLHGLRNACDLGASSGTVTNSYQMSVNPQHSSNAGTITNAYGLAILAGGTAGTITNGTGLYVGGPAFGTTRYSLYVDVPTGGSTNYCAVFVGAPIPVGNKTINLGSTTNRWNIVYNATNTTGTSRLADSRTTCTDCGVTMKRGTGTFVTLGESADYVPVFCPDCGDCKMEAIKHLPSQRLSQRQAAPKIEFLGFKVQQYSGNSSAIQVMFRYEDKETYFDEEERAWKDVPLSGKENSTYLSDSEYESFLLMSEIDQRNFIRDLGQREWDAMEEVRLMKEDCCSLQTDLDNICNKWMGTNLLEQPTIN